MNAGKKFIQRILGFAFCLVTLSTPLLASADAGGWQAAYWNNQDLSGAPVLQQFEADANHNPALIREWRQEQPWPQVEADHFSARFERTLSLQPGRYRFVATADDGVRVWVNGELIIDEWLNQPQTTYIGYADIQEAGDVPVKVEYYDDQHHARLNVSWEHVSGSDAILTDELYEPTITAWRGEYFNNRVVAGTPNLVRDDEAINFDWGLESPALEAINRDSFSVRWTRTLELSAGLYRFITVTDDGVRLYVNGRLLIDQWHTQANQSHTAEFNHPGGSVTLKMEYYDDIGLAQAQLNWEKVGEYTAVTTPTSAPPSWRGEYFNNTLLIGEPDLVRQDPAINFDWGFASPDEDYLPRSAFSVRWTGTLELPAGSYRFTTSTDDGVRLWVNNELIIDKWRNQAELAFSAEIDLPAGRIPVKMEYFNAENQAIAHLSWERLDGPLPENVLVGPETTAGTGSSVSTTTNLPQAAYLAETSLTAQTSTNILLGPLNVRAEPNLLANVLGKLLATDDVAIYGRSQFNNWVLVQLDDGRFGWISRLYTDLPYDISELPDVSLPWQPAPTADSGSSPVTVTRSSFLAQLHPQPNILTEPITTLPEDEPVEAVGRNHFSTWVKVRLNDGTEGWVSILTIAADFAINSLPDLEG
ncbi:MAG: SH3 domain-containing protein [Anaerolineaceae bacterium]|nr:SH3 domain-containing protein [Anaerolineaceae bacterium]